MLLQLLNCRQSKFWKVKKNLFSLNTCVVMQLHPLDSRGCCSPLITPYLQHYIIIIHNHVDLIGCLCLKIPFFFFFLNFLSRNTWSFCKRYQYRFLQNRLWFHFHFLEKISVVAWHQCELNPLRARNHIWVTSTGLSSHTKNIIILNIPHVVFLLMVTSQEFGIILTISCWRAATCWKLFAHCITCVTLRDKCHKFLVTNAWILVRKWLSLWLFTCTLLSYIYICLGKRIYPGSARNSTWHLLSLWFAAWDGNFS